MNIDVMMNQFRLASREVFNHYFRISDPYNNGGWELEERFWDVQAALFRKLVVEPASLPNIDYGDVQSSIQVKLNSDSVPAMVNRDVDSGYWDNHVKEVSQNARLLFVSFFDWDQLGYRDNRYVCVKIDCWDDHPELVGFRVLIESHCVKFVAR